MSEGINSVLTNYGNIIGPNKFEKIKERAVAKKFIQFKGLTYTYDQYKKIKISDKDYVQIPRGLIPIKASVRDHSKKIIDPVDIRLHDYQDLVVKHSVNALKADYHFLLQMDTGLGKSFVAAGIINKLRRRTCIVVCNKVLAQQMADDLVKAMGNTISISRKKDVIADINIVIINTAIKQPREFWGKFGLVILDEVHAYCSDTFMEVFWRADFAEYVFGMTATPERIDAMQSVMYMHLGKPIRAESIYSGLDSCRPGNFYGRVLRVNYFGPDEYTKTIVNKNGIMSTILMAKQFLEDDARMSMAARIVSELYDAGRNIYVFCQTKKPLRILRRRLVRCAGRDKAYRKRLKKDIHIVTGDSTQDETAAARSNAKVFLTTYALSSKGLSLPRFDSLLFLTPMKSNMEQICGRIFRKSSDESIERIIVDLIDMKTSIKKQWYKRNQEYQRRKLDVHLYEHHPSDQPNWLLLSTALNAGKLRDTEKMKKLGITMPQELLECPQNHAEVHKDD